jgi:hypothetical protein
MTRLPLRLRGGNRRQVDGGCRWWPPSRFVESDAYLCDVHALAGIDVTLLLETNTSQDRLKDGSAAPSRSQVTPTSVDPSPTRGFDVEADRGTARERLKWAKTAVRTLGIGGSRNVGRSA